MTFSLTPLHFVLLPILGGAVAALGTMVGLGGGFILVPILIFLFPEASPAALTTISLTVVFLNASSATIGNLAARCIDFRTAVLLVAGAVPAAIAGSATAQVVSRESFESMFGVLLIFGALYVLWRRWKVGAQDQSLLHEPNREIRERKGPIYRFYVDTIIALVVSPVAGFVSSFFGIGGGVIHVPALTFILKVPFRVASATALLVLVFTSITAISTLFFSGAIHEGWRRAALLGVGALFGAQLGVYLGRRVDAKVILPILSVAMALVGVRQLIAGLS
ncbi:MAG: sulfite exporter TauE/SafE family protein [Chloroflexi bacterium]|nr:sulfite exporter TauE/SafE family protein [Chloroflexota bacterium]